MIGALKFEDGSRPITEAIAGGAREIRPSSQIIVLITKAHSPRRSSSHREAPYAAARFDGRIDFPY
jgi:hypothetical protein